MGGPDPDPGPCPGDANDAYEVDLLGGAMRAANGSYGASSEKVERNRGSEDIGRNSKKKT